jgi:hypothetical protein
MNAGTSNMNVKSCGCACGGQCGCDSRCCELECLVRPNFFCGQMLTDADLAAMVEWTRSRLALARYRDGWGIACGLELSCSAPGGAASCCGDNATESGPAVYLNAGYALDCCGNDLVVCEPIKVNLGPVCRPADDPCDPRARTASTPQAVPGAQGEGAQADCLRLKPEDLVVVQLSLRYHEDLAQGQRAMFRGACSDDGPCQYARVLEHPCVHLEVIKPGEAQDDQSDEERWQAGFKRRLELEVDAIRAAVVGGMDAVLQYIRHNPPYQFCFLEDMACCLRKKETEKEKTSAEDRLHIAKLLFMDWLLRQLQCPCSNCLPDDGVPLGRIILRRSVVAGRTLCSVAMIDQGAAYRRALRKDPCRPVGIRKYDLAPYLGQPATSGLAQLRSLAIECEVIEGNPQNDEQLGAVVGGFTVATVTLDRAISGRLEVHLADDIAGTSRIAFFVQKRIFP